MRLWAAGMLGLLLVAGAGVVVGAYGLVEAGAEEPVDSCATGSCHPSSVITRLHERPTAAR